MSRQRRLAGKGPWACQLRPPYQFGPARGLPQPVPDGPAGVLPSSTRSGARGTKAGGRSPRPRGAGVFRVVSDGAADAEAQVTRRREEALDFAWALLTGRPGGRPPAPVPPGRSPAGGVRAHGTLCGDRGFRWRIQVAVRVSDDADMGGKRVGTPQFIRRPEVPINRSSRRPRRGHLTSSSCRNPARTSGARQVRQLLGPKKLGCRASQRQPLPTPEADPSRLPDLPRRPVRRPLTRPGPQMRGHRTESRVPDETTATTGAGDTARTRSSQRSMHRGAAARTPRWAESCSGPNTGLVRVSAPRAPRSRGALSTSLCLPCPKRTLICWVALGYDLGVCRAMLIFKTFPVRVTTYALVPMISSEVGRLRPVAMGVMVPSRRLTLSSAPVPGSAGVPSSWPGVK